MYRKPDETWHSSPQVGLHGVPVILDSVIPVRVIVQVLIKHHVLKQYTVQNCVNPILLYEGKLNKFDCCYGNWRGQQVLLSQY